MLALCIIEVQRGMRVVAAASAEERGVGVVAVREVCERCERDVRDVVSRVMWR